MTAGKSAPVANLRDAKKAQAQSRRTPGRKASASGQVGTGQSASREGRVQRDWTRRRSAPQHVGVGLDSRGRCPHCRSQTASRDTQVLPARGQHIGGPRRSTRPRRAGAATADGNLIKPLLGIV